MRIKEHTTTKRLQQYYNSKRNYVCVGYLKEEKKIVEK